MTGRPVRPTYVQLHNPQGFICGEASACPQSLQWRQTLLPTPPKHGKPCPGQQPRDWLPLLLWALTQLHLPLRHSMHIGVCGFKSAVKRRRHMVLEVVGHMWANASLKPPSTHALGANTKGLGIPTWHWVHWLGSSPCAAPEESTTSSLMYKMYKVRICVQSLLQYFVKLKSSIIHAAGAQTTLQVGPPQRGP